MSSEWQKILAVALGTAVTSILTTSGVLVTKDVTGARAYTEEKAEELARVRELERQVNALRAERAILLKLMDGAKLATSAIGEAPATSLHWELPPSARAFIEGEAED